MVHKTYDIPTYCGRNYGSGGKRIQFNVFISSNKYTKKQKKIYVTKPMIERNIYQM